MASLLTECDCHKDLGIEASPLRGLFSYGRCGLPIGEEARSDDLQIIASFGLRLGDSNLMNRAILSISTYTTGVMNKVRI
jgi:hypothetical protein